MLPIVSLQVDFATMTREQVDAEMETDIALETESIRTAEKYTSITKDTGKNSDWDLINRGYLLF